jgi:hypothetical protein
MVAHLERFPNPPVADEGLPLRCHTSLVLITTLRLLSAIQIFFRSYEQTAIIVEPANTFVALLAEKSSNCACVVIMINVKVPS